MRQVITDEEETFYHENGYLILRNALDSAELERTQEATQRLIDAAEPNRTDYAYRNGILQRIEFVVDKKEPMKALAGHPFILRTVEKLMGPDFLPTWDAMVLKMPGNGVAVPWHRDAAANTVGDKPIFNVDFYLDRATEENCVWAMPGSHRWSHETALTWQKEHHRYDLSVEDYRNLPGAVPILMEAGDVMLHDILVLHGSPTSTVEALRRVVYYEYRTAHVELELGPHTQEYIPLKQSVLLGCLKARRESNHVPIDEIPFEYVPPAPFDHGFNDTPPTYRYPHSDYWRI